MKLVICIQFCEQDRIRAMRLAESIARIAPRDGTEVSMMLANRFDCRPAESSALECISSGMPVEIFTTHTQGIGWPEGCNAMAFDIFREMGKRADTSPLLSGSAFLLIEPDCVIIDCDWIKKLMAEWRLAKLQGKHLMGAWRKSGPECGHVNGNAVFDLDIIRLTGISDAMNSIRSTAWDAALAPYFQPHWHLTGLISNRWNENSLTPEQIETPWMGVVPPVLVHGCKSDDVWNYAQQKLFQ